MDKCRSIHGYATAKLMSSITHRAWVSGPLSDRNQQFPVPGHDCQHLPCTLRYSPTPDVPTLDLLCQPPKPRTCLVESLIGHGIGETEKITPNRIARCIGDKIGGRDGSNTNPIYHQLNCLL